MKTEDILAENRRRNATLARDWDPLAGLNSRKLYGAARTAWVRARIHDDFALWAAYAVKIRDKRTGALVPFVLNRPQRRVAAMLDGMRRAGKPMRLIMLKARQWGGSTLIQVYMAWIQMVLRKNWNSLICAHVKDTSKTIRNMYTTLLDNYPGELLEPDAPRPVFRSFEGSQNTREIAGRGCQVTVASAERQDAIRGTNIAMAHLSEVAFWPATTLHSPEDVLRSVNGTVSCEPLTLNVIESTANGVGNFFHTEWLRAHSPKGSDRKPVFVPWYEIDMYSMDVDDPLGLWVSMDDYERELWNVHGCTLEQINWYRHKRAEYSTAAQMFAEFPTTAEEAFVASGANVFANDRIEALRRGCQPGVKGELSADGKTFVKDAAGDLTVWNVPASDVRYVVAVDVGGRSAAADWSVAAVLSVADMPEVVAQWRGHIDHDLLANKAIALARYYNNALLVIESNTLESENDATSPSSVLERVARTYTNTYRRRRGIVDGPGIGFHTNRRTKPLVINTLIAAVRETSYVEHDAEACNELATYARNPNGSYAARPGRHDDILMTRAIALHVIRDMPSDISVGDFGALFAFDTW